MQILSMQRKYSTTGSTNRLDDGLWKSYQKQMTYQKFVKSWTRSSKRVGKNWEKKWFQMQEKLLLWEEPKRMCIMLHQKRITGFLENCIKFITDRR